MAWLRGGECIYSGEASGGRMALAPLDTASVAALAGRVTHYLLAGVPAKASFFSAGFSKLRTRPLSGPPHCMRGSCTQAGQVDGRFAKRTTRASQTKPKARKRECRESYDNARRGPPCLRAACNRH